MQTEKMETFVETSLRHVHGLSGLATAMWLHNTAGEYGSKGMCIDVGSWVGFTAIAMALAGPTVLAVDTFDARDKYTGEKALAKCKSFYALGEEPDLYELFLDNVERANVEDRVFAARGLSVDTARAMPFEIADLVFIDGDHDEQACYQDLCHWAPILKRGGILAVDNYPQIGGVAKAVDRFIKETGWNPLKKQVDVLAMTWKPL